MTVWVVRGEGKYEGTYMSEGIISIRSDVDSAVTASITGFSSQKSLQGSAGYSNGMALWRFAREVLDGDTVVLALDPPKPISVGRVLGDYQFRPSLEPQHIRRVHWEYREIPRAEWNSDFPNSLVPGFDVFKSTIVDVARIEKTFHKYLSDSPVDAAPDSAGQAASSTVPGDDAPLRVDLEGLISDRIVERIRQRFSVGRLAYLVASILRASGYHAVETRQGLHSGVDVVAGPGDMGFGHPRLAVQVKFGSNPSDITDYNRLRDGIGSYGADRGLLVSLGGFTPEVRNENVRSFFQIRLWGSDELVNRLLETYDHLPEDIRGEIRLKSRGILMDTEC